MTSVAVIAGLIVLALGCSLRPALRFLAFPAWVVVSVATALMAPRVFGTWLGVDLRFLIVPLIQVITFGMGTTLSIADFTRVLRMPRPVFIGFALQFLVMPALGYLIATGFGFEPEVAAGIILVGSVSGGVASNLVTYLSGGDVALSVTMTACSTVASPFVTPLLMKLLAGRLIAIDVAAMMFEILGMILVPIAAGLFGHRILNDLDPRSRQPRYLLGLTAVCVIASFACIRAPWPTSAALTALRNGLVIGFALMALVTIVKWAMNLRNRTDARWVDRALTFISMFSICFVIGIITSRSQEKLLSVGALLLFAAVLHNSLGYLLGYWGARLTRLDERTARTVAIEVGMQNAGMASGLAMTVLNSTHAAIAPALFGPWMNLSGSLLAAWWKRNPPATPANASPITPTIPTPPRS